MDSDGLRMLHVLMLDYMRKMNMNQSTESFAREAGIHDTSSGFNPPDGFLVDWWSIFWYYYTERMYNSSNDSGITSESSIAAEAQVHAQAHAQTQHSGLAQAQVQAQSQAQAHQAYTQAQAQAQVQAQAQTYNDLGTNNPYIYTMEQASNQIFPFHGNTESIFRRPILGARGNDEEYSVLPSFINADFQRGRTFSEHSTDSRRNRNNMGRISRQSLHRVNRVGNQIERGATSNPISQRSMRAMNPTSQPRNTNSLDLNAIFEYFM